MFEAKDIEVAKIQDAQINYANSVLVQCRRDKFKGPRPKFVLL